MILKVKIIIIYYINNYQIRSDQSHSCVRLFATPWIAARQASLSITNSQSSLRLMSTSQWCHPAISSSVVPFSSCHQSLPASPSFPMSQLFAWGGQSTGVSALALFLPKNTQGWSPLEWTLESRRRIRSQNSLRGLGVLCQKRKRRHHPRRNDRKSAHEKKEDRIL